MRNGSDSCVLNNNNNNENDVDNDDNDEEKDSGHRLIPWILNNHAFDSIPTNVYSTRAIVFFSLYIHAKIRLLADNLCPVFSSLSLSRSQFLVGDAVTVNGHERETAKKQNRKKEKKINYLRNNSNRMLVCPFIATLEWNFRNYELNNKNSGAYVFVCMSTREQIETWFHVIISLLGCVRAHRAENLSARCAIRKLPGHHKRPYVLVARCLSFSVVVVRYLRFLNMSGSFH